MEGYPESADGNGDDPGCFTLFPSTLIVDQVVAISAIR